MAGTATRYDSTLIRAGSVGQLWYNVAVPSASNRITLHTDGTPDSTANPNAKHLGMTMAGATCKVTTSITDFFGDEFQEPIKSVVEQVEATIEGSLIQLFDVEALTALTQAVGTAGTGTGYKQFQMGRKEPSYAPIALIFPTEADATKFAVFNLYKALNTAPLEFNVGRKAMTEIPFSFKGYGITTRAAADTLGNFWWQVA